MHASSCLQGARMSQAWIGQDSAVLRPRNIWCTWRSSPLKCETPCSAGVGAMSVTSQARPRAAQEFLWPLEVPWTARRKPPPDPRPHPAPLEPGEVPVLVPAMALALPMFAIFPETEEKDWDAYSGLSWSDTPRRGGSTDEAHSQPCKPSGRAPQRCSAAQNMHRYLCMPIFAIPPEAEEKDWDENGGLSCSDAPGWGGANEANFHQCEPSETVQLCSGAAAHAYVLYGYITWHAARPCWPPDLDLFAPVCASLYNLTHSRRVLACTSVCYKLCCAVALAALVSVQVPVAPKQVNHLQSWHAPSAEGLPQLHAGAQGAGAGAQGAHIDLLSCCVPDIAVCVAQLRRHRVT